jgi:hypothetical protein
MFSHRNTIATVLAALACLTMDAHAQIAVRNQGYIPFSDAPINYRSNDLSDPVTKLEQQLEQGKTTLTYDSDHGYLRSVLKLLDVPVDSQTLVFSKTSFQYPKISAEHPRALYFNDDIYVGSVHEGKAIEIVSFDPRQGAIFYLLDERKVEHPAFQRAELDCTQCHIAAGTRGIPGVLLRSVYPTAAGTLVAGSKSFITDQNSPLSERWGGWYVTGNVPGAHLGNTAVDEKQPASGPSERGAAVKLVTLDKTFDSGAYLFSDGSDVVAHLVLAHQTQMHNLITLTNYKTRLALYSQTPQTSSTGTSGTGNTEAANNGAAADSLRQQIERPAEQLLRYLLFANEAPLDPAGKERVGAGSSFAREFEARGLKDPKGRSLRDFDLHTRIFRYPCSYLIYSDSFDALPAPAKDYVYHRLLEILSGRDRSEDFARLSMEDRRAVLEIILATKSGLPDEWKDYGRSNHIRVAATSGATSSDR